MLPGVKNIIKDGAMGVLGADATGIFGAVGVASKPSNGILIITDPEKVDEAIGDGPLRDLLVSALSLAKTTVYAVALEGTVAGTISKVTPGIENTGIGTVAASGSPRNEYDVKVSIVSGGGLNAATFRVTIDGAQGKVLTVPDGNGQYVIPDTGITLSFDPGEGSFAEGDVFTFDTTAPQATNGEVLAAIDAILEAKYALEWIAVAGISSAALWAALATKAEGAAEIYQYLFFIAEARYKAKTAYAQATVRISNTTDSSLAIPAGTNYQYNDGDKDWAIPFAVLETIPANGNVVKTIKAATPGVDSALQTGVLSPELVTPNIPVGLTVECIAVTQGADDETVDQWVGALTGSERGSVASPRLQVCAGWIEESDANGQIDVRNMVGTYCGKLAQRKVHQGPDAVRWGGISAANALKPDGINDGHIEALKNAGYVTARKIIGLTGIYVTSGQMMSEAGSDFDLVERRRVMDKACRQVRAAQLFSVNDVVKVGADGSPEGLEMLIAQSENPLKIMVTNEEISDGYVVIPEGQNILSTSTLRMKVRIVPLGKLAYIENEIAFSNPALGGEK